MARPLKEGLDYFPHDVDASSDEKIEALRSLYGNDGYAFYFIMLERIYRTQNFELDISDAETREETIQILAKKVGVSAEKFRQILDTSFRWGCFDKKEYEERGVITSRGIKARARIVLDKREQQRKKYRKDQEISDAETREETTQETMSETPQSKVKKSKGKESKEKKSIVSENSENDDNEVDPTELITAYWKQPQFALQRLPLNPTSTNAAIKKALSLYSKEQITTAIKNYAEILNSKEYLLNQRWTLANFLDHDSFERFLNIEEAKKFYRRGNHRDYDESLEAIENFSLEEIDNA